MMPFDQTIYDRQPDRVVHKIAVSSTGPLSGKTTWAKYLEENYGFIRADHSLTLTELFVADWNDHLPRPPITVEMVYADKDYYRPMLQSFGDESGFNEGDGMVWFIKRTLREWLSLKPQRHVIYDSVRTEGQAGVLKSMGFETVQLKISEDLRRERAAIKGFDYEQIMAAVEARPDLEKGLAHPDITFYNQKELELMSRAVMYKPWRDHYMTLAHG